MKLRCKDLGNKKVLLIPPEFSDMFTPGKDYGPFKCIRVARQLALYIPQELADQFKDGEEYEVRF